MKKLNGKLYFDKKDTEDAKKEAIFYLDHPTDEHEFLYIIDSNEKKCVVDGVNGLNNTFSWEFTTEKAINMKTIDRCYNSLRIHSTSLISYNEYYEIKPVQRTSYVEKKFANWLNAQGHLILYNVLNKLNKS